MLSEQSGYSLSLLNTAKETIRVETIPVMDLKDLSRICHRTNV